MVKTEKIISQDTMANEELIHVQDTTQNHQLEFGGNKLKKRHWKLIKENSNKAKLQSAHQIVSVTYQKKQLSEKLLFTVNNIVHIVNNTF